MADDVSFAEEGEGGSAASWLRGSRRKALTLLERHIAGPAMPNVRANRTAEASAVSPG